MIPNFDSVFDLAREGLPRSGLVLHEGYCSLIVNLSTLMCHRYFGVSRSCVRKVIHMVLYGVLRTTRCGTAFKNWDVADLPIVPGC
jgi:hypothetical protein